ncbi:MAG: TPM domain-containing protein, partial [Gemmatimonadaceae bacterium]
MGIERDRDRDARPGSTPDLRSPLSISHSPFPIPAFLGIGAILALQAIQVPQPRGFVNDFADVVPAESEARIQRIVEDVREKSGGEIVIVTLPDLGQRDVADIAREIGRQWGVGRAGEPGDPARNTGVIVLVVPKETSADGRGRFRIETGYGAEGFLPDPV